MHSTSRNPTERSPANGASADPAGLKLTCGLADGGREKTETPHRRHNTASLFNPRQIHRSRADGRGQYGNERQTAVGSNPSSLE